MEGLLQKHQRDLNRIADSDRNTRKRGLLKILEELPWTQRDETMRDLVLTHLLGGTQPLFATVCDAVEKCRETSLQVLGKCLDNCAADIPSSTLSQLIVVLSGRINDSPFPEGTEELRLQVTELIHKILKLPKVVLDQGCIDVLVGAMIRALQDPFPSAKRACSELIIFIAQSWGDSICSGFKKLLASLHGNAQHQHSKTRIVTVRAIGAVVGCVTAAARDSDFEAAMKELLMPLFHLLVADTSVSTRKELASVTGGMIGLRLTRPGGSIAPVDLELVILQLLLCGDETSEVAVLAMDAFNAATACWKGQAFNPDGAFDDNGHIVDGEVELRASAAAATMEVDTPDTPLPGTDDDSAYTGQERLQGFLKAHLIPLAQLLITGVGNWTADSRRRYLHALGQFLSLVTIKSEALLLPLMSALGGPCRDEEPAVRAAAEAAAAQLGSLVSPVQALDLAMPRVCGQVPGGDTASARAHAMRVLACLIKGFPAPHSQLVVASTAGAEGCVERIAQGLSSAATFDFREPFYKEALLLLLRGLIAAFPVQSAGQRAESYLCLCLLQLQARSEGAELVVEAARRELAKLATIGTDKSALESEAASATAVAAMLGRHFPFLLGELCAFVEKWDTGSASKAAFEALIRGAPTHAWTHHEEILAAITPMLQPPPLPPTDTPEAHALSYAAQRGEETISLGAEVSLRLALLAMLEGWVRAGAADWQCGQYLGKSAARILKEVVVSNLVWRVGRVESTARKVALAVAHGLLRAGAAPPEALYKASPELVPLLASALDDNDTSMRHMACLCLLVIFERLRGAFGPQAVTELYPILIKRLDDSSDDVRIEGCRVLAAFMAAVQPSAFSGTPLDYTLDVLFVHLDDPEPTVQQAVLQAILQASRLDRALVLKKVEANRTTLRSPDMCNAIAALVAANPQ